MGQEQIFGAGYTAEQLREAGYTVKQLMDHNYTDEEVLQAGYDVEELRAAGYTDEQILDAVLRAGYSAEQLREACYTIEQLQAHDYTDDQILRAGYTAEELREAGFTDEQINCIAEEITDLFEAAVEWMSIAGADVDGFSDEIKLAMYGSFQQAMKGDCPPELTRPLGRESGKKWDAWNANCGSTTQAAMKRYLALLDEACPNWLEKASAVLTSRKPGAEAGMFSLLNSPRRDATPRGKKQ